MTSKPVSPAPSRVRARASRLTQSARLAQAANAVVLAAGSGASFIVAAVMMPSVPSLPTNRSRRS